MDLYNFKTIDNFEAHQVPTMQEDEANKDFEERCKPLGRFLVDQDAEDIEFETKFDFVAFNHRGQRWMVRGGDWIVKLDGFGQIDFVTNEDFEKYYAKIEDENAAESPA